MLKLAFPPSLPPSNPHRKNHINIKKHPENLPVGIPPKIWLYGVLRLDKKGEEAPPHKKLGLSNIHARDPFESFYVGILDVILSPLDSEMLASVFAGEASFKRDHAERECLEIEQVLLELT